MCLFKLNACHWRDLHASMPVVGPPKRECWASFKSFTLSVPGESGCRAVDRPGTTYLVYSFLWVDEIKPKQRQSTRTLLRIQLSVLLKTLPFHLQIVFQLFLSSCCLCYNINVTIYLKISPMATVFLMNPSGRHIHRAILWAPHRKRAAALKIFIDTFKKWTF